MLTIGIIKSNTLLSESLEQFLKTKQFQVVACSDNLNDLLEIENGIDVFVFELKNNDISNFKYELQINKPILFVLTSFDKSMVFKLANTKVSGVVTNDNSLDDFTEAILTLSKGQKYYSNKILNNETLEYFIELHSTGKIQKSLSKREVEVISLLKKGYKIKQIAQKLELSPRTVSKHKENVLIKLKTRELSKVYEYFDKYHK